MKLLMCESCGDIIAPFRKANQPRYCNCGLHACWWEDPAKGIFKTHDHRGVLGNPLGGVPRAYVIGLHNSYLGYPGTITKAVVDLILETTPESYLFKQQGSCVVRFRPGESSDTGWAPLPKDHRYDLIEDHDADDA